jgi:chromosome segregation ATPase
MADPPAGPPAASPTNTQLNTEFSVEDFQPRVTNIPTRVTRKRGRHNESYAPEESTGRVTTREVWRLIDELKDIIHRQTTLIESTKAELQEVKHEQNVLQDQNQKLYEEVKALRTQLDNPLPAPSARSWAAVAASADNADLLPRP